MDDLISMLGMLKIKTTSLLPSDREELINQYLKLKVNELESQKNSKVQTDSAQPNAMMKLMEQFILMKIEELEKEKNSKQNQLDLDSLNDQMKRLLKLKLEKSLNEETSRSSGEKSSDDLDRLMMDFIKKSSIDTTQSGTQGSTDLSGCSNQFLQNNKTMPGKSYHDPEWLPGSSKENNRNNFHFNDNMSHSRLPAQYHQISSLMGQNYNLPYTPPRGPPHFNPNPYPAYPNRFNPPNDPKSFQINGMNNFQQFPYPPPPHFPVQMGPNMPHFMQMVPDQVTMINQRKNPCQNVKPNKGQLNQNKQSNVQPKKQPNNNGNTNTSKQTKIQEKQPKSNRRTEFKKKKSNTKVPHPNSENKDSESDNELVNVGKSWEIINKSGEKKDQNTVLPNAKQPNEKPTNQNTGEINLNIIKSNGGAIKKTTATSAKGKINEKTASVDKGGNKNKSNEKTASFYEQGAKKKTNEKTASVDNKGGDKKKTNENMASVDKECDKSIPTPKTGAIKKNKPLKAKTIDKEKLIQIINDENTRELINFPTLDGVVSQKYKLDKEVKNVFLLRKKCDFDLIEEPKTVYDMIYFKSNYPDAIAYVKL